MDRVATALHLRGYSRRELPGWSRVLKAAGVFDDALWARAPTLPAVGKLHGFRMELDLRNWSERQTYFLGRFYDLPTQLLLMRLLKAGNVFVDIGANIGMITALAAKCVGPTGKVLSFEPNPDALRKLRKLIDANGLGSRVDVRPVALSNTAGTMTLSVITDHTGMGTLSAVPDSQKSFVSQTHPVEVLVGDEALKDAGRIAGIKIDVEGFESHVFAGLDGTLRRDRPWVIAEVVEDHLLRAGSSSRAVLSTFAERGYRAFAMSVRRTGLGHGLQLRPVSVDDAPYRGDAVFLPADSPFIDRLAD